MARRLKRRPWTEGERAYKYIHDLAAQNNNLPETAFLSRLVIAALLGRMKHRNAKEARFLINQIALLTGMEALLPGSRQILTMLQSPEPASYAIDLERTYRSLLSDIVSKKVPKADHDQHAMLDQRKWLNAYFHDHPIKSSAPARHYLNWLARHSEKVYAELSNYRCLCEYRESFNGIDQDDLTHCHGPADITHLLLSKLHQSTPLAIRKQLSHPPTNS